MCNTGRPNSKNMTMSRHLTPGQAPIDYSQVTDQSYRPYDIESSKYQNDSYCPTPHDSNGDQGDLYINTTIDDNRDEKLMQCQTQIEALTNLVQTLQNQIMGRQVTDDDKQHTSYFKGAQFLIEDQNH